MVTCIHVPCFFIHNTPLSVSVHSFVYLCLCHSRCVVQACLGLTMYTMLSLNLRQDSSFKCPSFKKQFYYIICSCVYVYCCCMFTQVGVQTLPFSMTLPLFVSHSPSFPPLFSSVRALNMIQACLLGNLPKTIWAFQIMIL